MHPPHPEPAHPSSFVHALTTPAMVSTQHIAEPVSTTSEHPTIKMEDLSMSTTLMDTPVYTNTSSQSPPATTTETKPAKKRKSWGQVLPEPKTNLPPRKRAKTEDEKEQRRIERVKRNRLAAHNSRERKRQEVENLQAEKNKVEEKCRQYEALLAQWAAKIKHTQQLHPEVHLDIDTEEFDVQFANRYATPAPSSVHTPRETSETIHLNHITSSQEFPSPVSLSMSYSSRDNSLQPETPPAYGATFAPVLDQTRYPAAILCDLQCQSTTTRSRPSASAASAAISFLLLLLSTFPIWTPPRPASPTTHSSPSTLSLSRPLTAFWTMWASLVTSSSTPPSTKRILPSPLSALMQVLLRATPSSTSRQRLAQLRLATAVEQSGASGSASGTCGQRQSRAGCGAKLGSRCNNSLRASQHRIRLRQQRFAGRRLLQLP